MSNFIFSPTFIDGLYEIEAFCADDERGFFSKTFEKNIFKHNGINFEVVESLFSYSKKGVLRGLHFQYKEPQAKLVNVTHGEVFDVAVDLRTNSKTYKKWYGTTLTKNKMLYIPRGFAHGVLALTDEVCLTYHCDNKYYKEYDSGIIYNDTDIGVEWPDINMDFIISDKDKKLGTLRDIHI